MKHLIDLQQFNEFDYQEVFDRASFFIKHPFGQDLCNKSICSLFFEDSTRTATSFQIAVKSLGANWLDFNTKTSSLSKGEDLAGTLETLIALGVNGVIIRHTDDLILDNLIQQVANLVPLINAGTGISSHPTQVLADALTIHQEFGGFSDLSVSIVGNASHSRVFRSLIELFKVMKIRRLRLVAPPAFISEDIRSLKNLEIVEDLATGIKDANIVLGLRIQFERIANANHTIDLPSYIQNYTLTESMIERYTATNSIVMHPGPVNWGVEMENGLAHHPKLRVLKQVANGLAVRKAILTKFIH